MSSWSLSAWHSEMIYECSCMIYNIDIVDYRLVKGQQCLKNSIRTSDQLQEDCCFFSFSSVKNWRVSNLLLLKTFASRGICDIIWHLIMMKQKLHYFICGSYTDLHLGLPQPSHQLKDEAASDIALQDQLSQICCYMQYILSRGNG